MQICNVSYLFIFKMKSRFSFHVLHVLVNVVVATGTEFNKVNVLSYLFTYLLRNLHIYINLKTHFPIKILFLDYQINKYKILTK